MIASNSRIGFTSVRSRNLRLQLKSIARHSGVGPGRNSKADVRAKEKSTCPRTFARRSSGSKAATGLPRSVRPDIYVACYSVTTKSRRTDDGGDRDQDVSSTSDIDVGSAHSRPFIRDFRHPAVRHWRTGALRETESSPRLPNPLSGPEGPVESSRGRRAFRHSRVVLTFARRTRSLVRDRPRRPETSVLRVSYENIKRADLARSFLPHS